MPSSAPPLSAFARPRVVAADAQNDMPTSSSVKTFTITGGNQATRALGIAVAVCRGTDSGSWTAGISSQSNLLSVADSLRFVVGFTTSPSTAVTFTRSGTNAAAVSFMHVVVTPFGGTATYAGTNAQFVGEANVTDADFAYHAYTHGGDLRLAFAASENRSGGSPESPAPTVSYTEKLLFQPSSPRMLWIGQETPEKYKTDIAAATSYTFSTGHRTGVLQLNIQNRLR